MTIRSVSASPSFIQDALDPMFDQEDSLEISNMESTIAIDRSASAFMVRFLTDISPLGIAPEDHNFLDINSRKINANVLLAELCIQEAFQEKNLKVQRIDENLNQFICVASCFSDIENIVKSLPEHVKKHISCFYYSPEKQAICFEMSNDPIGCSKIEYPTGDEWMSLLKASRESKIDHVNKLLLTNGHHVSEEEFTRNPLFASTLEKEAIFQRLCDLIEDEGFQVKYVAFLEKVKGSDLDWADSYIENPIDLAYVSLYAYLNREIDRDDLFMAHMIASAFKESPTNASYTVLTKENAKEHLKKNNYITYLRSRFCLECLKDIEEKGVLKRTTISYVSDGGIEQEVYESNQIFDQITFGQVMLENGMYRTTLLPPQLVKDLFVETLHNDEIPDPPMQHKESFGYRRVVKDLFFGRPISRASPLFFMPPVHGVAGYQLGIIAHDELFHCPLDWINPYTQSIIDCGKEIYLDKSLGEEFKPIAIQILDRAFTIESTADFFEQEVLERIKGFSELKQRILFEICIDHLPIKLLQEIGEIEMGKKYLFLEWLKENNS